MPAADCRSSRPHPSARVSRMARRASLRARPEKRSTRSLRQSPALCRLLGGIAEARPISGTSCAPTPRRLLRLLSHDPDEQMAGLLAKAHRGGTARATRRTDAHSTPDEGRGRPLIALADIGGVWPVAARDARAYRSADTALGAAVRYLLRDAAERASSSRPIRAIPKRAPATSCSPWARWAAIRAQLFQRHRSDGVL